MISKKQLIILLLLFLVIVPAVFLFGKNYFASQQVVPVIKTSTNENTNKEKIAKLVSEQQQKIKDEADFKKALNGPIEDCSKLKIASDSAACDSAHIIAKAGETGDLNLCSELSERIKQACIDQAAHVYAMRNYNGLFCNKIIDSVRKKDCLDFFTRLIKKQ